MRNETSIQGKVAREYCQKFQKTPSLTLAKKLYKENPKLYSTIDTARGLIRYIRGKSGDESRRVLTDKSLVQDKISPYNPFQLPEPKTEKTPVFNLPTSIRKVLLIGDQHFPYHDIKAITASIQDGKKEGVDCIFILGDMLDFYQLSFHEKDPRKTSISEELEMGRAFLKSLRKNFPLATIYYIPGNHEYRMERYLRVKAPELLDMEEFKLDILLNCREYDVIYLKHGTKTYFGKLLVEHGDKMRGSGGVNPARTLSLRIKRHSICGHFHRTTESISKIYDGDSIVTYSIGCQSELEPDYMPINEWNHGHAIITMLGNGQFSVSNRKVVNGIIY